MKFLQLTDAAEGTSVWVNMDHVTTIAWDGETTQTEMYFVDGSSNTVTERPQEIMRLLAPLVQ